MVDRSKEAKEERSTAFALSSATTDDIGPFSGHMGGTMQKS
jgi:hypothetical protein